MKEIKYYINTFIIYSVIGFIMETSLKYLFFPKLNNGFLYGPWIPIYGLGVCLIIIIKRFIFNRIKSSRKIKTLLLFLISIIILTILEFIGGNLIELFTGKVFWKYDNLKYNFGHYISLEISLVWGAMSLIIAYIIEPSLDKIIKKIPSIITYLVLMLIIFDFIFNLI